MARSTVLAILLVQLAAAGAQECADYVSDAGESWADSSGDGCDRYGSRRWCRCGGNPAAQALTPGNMSLAFNSARGDRADANGMNALEACCICQPEEPCPAIEPCELYVPYTGSSPRIAGEAYGECCSVSCCISTFATICTADDDCHSFRNYDIGSQRCEDTAGCADNPIRVGFAQCTLQAQLGPLVPYEDCVTQSTSREDITQSTSREDIDCCYRSYQHQCTTDEDCRPFRDFDMGSQRCEDAAGCADNPIRNGWNQCVVSITPPAPAPAPPTASGTASTAAGAAALIVAAIANAA